LETATIYQVNYDESQKEEWWTVVHAASMSCCFASSFIDKSEIAQALEIEKGVQLSSGLPPA
jgi:hypothetical protein